MKIQMAKKGQKLSQKGEMDEIEYIFKRVLTKNLEEKDGQRQLLYYVSLIRACNKVLYQLVYIGKKFVFLKKNLGI